MIKLIRGDRVVASGRSPDLAVRQGARLVVSSSSERTVALYDPETDTGYGGLRHDDTEAFWPLVPVPGDTVRCATRDGHVGVVLSTDDPDAWGDAWEFRRRTPGADTGSASRPVPWPSCPVRWPWGVTWDRDLIVVSTEEH